MSVTVNVNGVAISYPRTGDVEWGDEATEFAIQVGSVLQKIGQGNQTPTTDNIAISPGNLTVTSGNLSVGGNTTLTGNLTANGNTTLGNATSDTIAVTGILNVDSGTLYVNPTDNRVGINDSTPSEALDVTGNALISGTLGVTGNTTITGDVITSIVKASGSGGLTIDSNNGTDVALFGAGGGSGTTLYGGLNGTSATFSSIISNSDGTVSAPSITFTNDTNTGLYRIGADEIGVTTNGIQRTKIGSYGVYTSGSIVQVASTTKTDTFSTTSLSFDDITGLSVSITPKFASSKILVAVSVAKGTSADDVGAFELRRDSTSIAIADSGGGIRSSMTAYYGGTTATVQLNTLSLTHLDSPATTSTITYSLRGRQHTTGTLWVNRNNNDSWRAVSSITVMEVAA
jgi:hypothetical protein